MKSIFKIVLLFYLICGCSFLFAVESAGQVEFNIRFYDRRIYYVESDPILVQITITNNSPAPYRFKLADERAFSVDFDIWTMANRQLQAADVLTRLRTNNLHVYFREIAIESGESFSFVEDLRNYVKFVQPGSFRLRAKVYPELYRNSSIPALESNYLNLSLRPASIRGADGIPLDLDVATGAVLVRQRLSPDEVVTYMLNARQTSQWERYFLYLDLESLLKQDAVQRRRWEAENEDGRRRMIAAFRRELSDPTLDRDISIIPTTFEIQRTVYNSSEGTVTVLQKYRNPNYTELRRYTYYVKKEDDFWVIYNYSLEGLGTEANN